MMKIQGETKRTNFKMYKDGKNWIFACAVLGSLMIGATTVQADSIPDTTTPTTQTTPTETKALQPGDVVTEYIPASDVDSNAANESTTEYYQGLDGTYTQSPDSTYSPVTPEQQADIDAASDADATSTEYSDNLNKIADAVANGDSSVSDNGKNYKVESTTDPSTLPADLNADSIYSETVRHYLETAAATGSDLTHTLTKVGNIFYHIVENNGAYSFQPLTQAELVDLQSAIAAGVVTTIPYSGTSADLEAAYNNGSDYVGNGFKIITVDDASLIPAGAVSADLSTTADTNYANPDNVQNIVGYKVKNIVKEFGNYFSYVVNADGTVTKTLLTIPADKLAQFESSLKNTTLEMSGDDAKNQAITDAIEAAVKAGKSIVTVDGVDYLIHTTTNEADLPKDAATYSVFSPDALPATNPKDKLPLQTIDAVNPGVKISIKDYWLDPKNNYEGTGTHLGSNLTGLGINKDHTLKFSSGGNGITNAADYNKWVSQVYVPGILAAELGADGYPVLNAAKVGTNNVESLAYLFDNTSDPNGYASYASEQLLNMFISNGYGGYSFDSLQNYIYYDAETGNFAVYNLPNKAQSGANGQLFPFNTVEDFFKNGTAASFPASVDQTLSNTTGNRVNHYFGISMETDYVHPENGLVSDGLGGTEPMIFEFSGDDDFWLYIDGKLVLDLGGIHDTMIGSINFATGVVYAKIGNMTSTLYLKDLLGDDWDVAGDHHKMNIFYMERGNNLSNLKVTFNLQIPQYYYATKTTVAEKTTQAEEKYIYATDQDTYATSDVTTHSFATRSDYGKREHTVALLNVHHLTPEANRAIAEALHAAGIDTVSDNPNILQNSDTDEGYFYLQSSTSDPDIFIGIIAEALDRVAELEGYGFELEGYRIGANGEFIPAANRIAVPIVDPITDVYFYYLVDAKEPPKPPVVDPDPDPEPETPTPEIPEVVTPEDPEANTPQVSTSAPTPVAIETSKAPETAPVVSASVLPQTGETNEKTNIWGIILLAMTNMLVLLKMRSTVKAGKRRKK